MSAGAGVRAVGQRMAVVLGAVEREQEYFIDVQ